MRLKDVDNIDNLLYLEQKRLESNDDRTWERNRKYYRGIAFARRILEDAPTIDVPDKKVGKWEGIMYYNATYHCEDQNLELQMIEARCSSCGLYSDFESNRFNNIVNYCPHCGADMIGEENG